MVSSISNMKYSIYYKPFLITVKLFQVWQYITNNSIRQALAYTQLNSIRVLFLTIQFSISHLFADLLNAKQFYLTHRYDPIRCYQSESEWIWEQFKWRGTSYALELHTCILIIKLSCVIRRTFVSRGLTPLQRWIWRILDLKQTDFKRISSTIRFLLVHLKLNVSQPDDFLILV